MFQRTHISVFLSVNLQSFVTITFLEGNTSQWNWNKLVCVVVWLPTWSKYEWRHMYFLFKFLSFQSSNNLDLENVSMICYSNSLLDNFTNTTTTFYSSMPRLFFFFTVREFSWLMANKHFLLLPWSKSHLQVGSGTTPADHYLTTDLHTERI